MRKHSIRIFFEQPFCNILVVNGYMCVACYSYSASWCNEHFIHIKAMKKVKYVCSLIVSD